MGSTLIKMANFLAKMSTPKWNSCKFTRGFCRVGYWAMSEIYVCFSNAVRGVETFRGSCENTYPWPYRCAEEFANWPEEADAEKGYTLICDYSGFVIRRGPSYVAWKLRERRSRWLRTQSGNHPHAKEWLGYLEELGYSERWTTQEIINLYSLRSESLPADEVLQSMPYFVGVNPKYGEYGQVYWLENVVMHAEATDWRKMTIVATTYEDFEFKIFNLTNKDVVTWVKIG